MRALGLALVLILGAVLGFGGGRTARVLPVAPPLTHVPGLGVDVLAQGAAAPPDSLRRAVAQVVQATGTPAQRAAARGLEAPPSMKVMEGQRLRGAVQEDAVALARVLGPERVSAMLRARPQLAEAYGELEVWTALAR